MRIVRVGTRRHGGVIPRSLSVFAASTPFAQARPAAPSFAWPRIPTTPAATDCAVPVPTTNDIRARVGLPLVTPGTVPTPPDGLPPTMNAAPAHATATAEVRRAAPLASRHQSTSTPPGGEPIEAATEAEIIAAVREMIACENAGHPLVGVTAHDDPVHRQGPYAQEQLLRWVDSLPDSREEVGGRYRYDADRCSPSLMSHASLTVASVSRSRTRLGHDRPESTPTMGPGFVIASAGPATTPDLYPRSNILRFANGQAG